MEEIAITLKEQVSISLKIHAEESISLTALRKEFFFFGEEVSIFHREVFVSPKA